MFLPLSVSHSVDRGGCLPQCMLGYTPPLEDTPHSQTPLPGITPLSPADGYCSGRYTFYWNAFLLSIKLLVVSGFQCNVYQIPLHPVKYTRIRLQWVRFQRAPVVATSRFLDIKILKSSVTTSNHLQRTGSFASICSLYEGTSVCSPGKKKSVMCRVFTCIEQSLRMYTTSTVTTSTGHSK